MKKRALSVNALAERRARVAAELERVVERAAKLNERAVTLSAEVEVLDRAIVAKDRRLDPTRIRSIHASKGRYGKRGALRESICRSLREGGPEWRTSLEIGESVRAELGISFELPEERAHWHRHSLQGVFRVLLAEGLVERQPWAPGTNEAGRWRWKQFKQMTLADLRAKAADPSSLS